MQTRELSGFHELLLRAAAGEVSFNEIIKVVTNHHDAAGGIVLELNRKTGRIVDFVSPDMVIGEGGYHQRLNSINPRMRYSMSHAPGHIAYENRFIDQRGMAHHEFYDWLRREKSLQYFLGSRLYDEGDISVCHTIQFGLGREHPDSAKIKEFSRTSRAIGNAWKLARRVQFDDLDRGWNNWTPDHLPWAIFALGPDAGVIQMNARASALIREGHLLQIDGNQLCPQDTHSSERFQAALRDTLYGNGQDLLLNSTETQMRFAAQTVPVQSAGRYRQPQISILVYVWNPIEGLGDKASILSSLWGLTDAEARLAMILAQGVRIADAADRLTISRNTARNQLQCIFEKMQINRQTELALKIFGVIERP